MSAPMPDFAMPSEEELAGERRTARESSPTPPASSDGADLSPPDPASRVAASPSARRGPAASSRRARAAILVRRPVVAFAAGAALASAGFLAVPPLTEWSEQGSATQLQRVLDDYVAAVEAGDVEAALALHRPSDEEGSVALLEAGVRAEAPPGIECDEAVVVGDGEAASASCSIAVDGYGSDGSGTQLRFERVEGSWRVSTGLARRADLRAQLVEVVAIAGVPMDGLLERPQSVWLLPGTYAIETRASELIEVVDLGGLVVTADGGFLGAYAQPGPALVAAAEAAAIDFVESCSVDAATASSCRIVPPDADARLAATAESSAYARDASTMIVPVRVTGTGSPYAPVVEVAVRFTDDWSSYGLEVFRVAETYP